MAKSKKFGMFGGVFTPSILTILGVIMYLRFPAIIGQAGLINTIGIIVLAHIISFTTSLSVASLSTDKPVQTGGTYFMISRSLGLPIGGTLGLALFVGLSFSVSLYLIGFAESFLQYWGLNDSIQNIRITGTLVLIAVTTITFISTSLAIKSQYFIMAAIGLSLLSIFLGKHEFAPTEIHFTALKDAAPFMVLFGIFFPAVTGFEAGVSMSGDLKNPKKALPLGAILAVSIGFIVYIILAVFYTYTVDAEILAHDPTVLFKIALVPELVIIGIWGATLSSALGSILGAPRILQAIAMDRIAPKIFARGTRKTNEPRNALLLAFVIAEMGILIGELDVIARIVSMFFITTYAFLNLASAIESWSSSDFRPAFKIPRFVSILGTISAFIVMVLLDFLALAGATIVLGGLFFYLRRKELILDSGDAWSSFWTNLAKRSLLRLSAEKGNNRNWRPNIILFRGDGQARPYLVEIGLALSGKLGSLTDFNLIFKPKAKHKRLSEPVVKSAKNISYFKRQFECENLESGISAVTDIYGFSGFEPNTVLMGWSKNSENASLLTRILNDFKKKKLNAIMLDFDVNHAYGKKEKIDVWWNGKGRHLSFSLHLLRFLLSDPAWRDASVRILIINNNSSLDDKIYRDTAALLNEKRMQASVKVLRDDFGTRNMESIINKESEGTDLILIGLTPKSEAYTKKYVTTINSIARMPASLLLLSPSDEFEEIEIISSENKTKPNVFNPSHSIELAPLPIIDNKVMEGRIEKVDSALLEMANRVLEHTIEPFFEALSKLQNDAYAMVEKSVDLQLTSLKSSNHTDDKKSLYKNHLQFLHQAFLEFSNVSPKTIAEAQKTLNTGMADYIARIGNFVYELPDEILISFIDETTGKEKSYTLPYRQSVSHYIDLLIYPGLITQLKSIETRSIKYLQDLRQLIFSLNDDFEKGFVDNQDFFNTPWKHRYIHSFGESRKELTAWQHQVSDAFLHTSRDVGIQLSSDTRDIKALQVLKQKARKKHKTDMAFFDDYSDNWGTAMELINNTVRLDTLVLLKQKIVKNLVARHLLKMKGLVTDQLLSPIASLIDSITLDTKPSETSPIQFPEAIDLKVMVEKLYQKITILLNDIPQEISLPELLRIDNQWLELAEITEVNPALKKVVTYYFDTLFYEPLYRESEAFTKEISRALITCKEANSMLLFKANNPIYDMDEDLADLSLSTGLQDSLLEQMKKEQSAIQRLLDQSLRNAEAYLQNAFSNLYYHSVLDAGKKIGSNKRERSGQRFGLLFSRKVNQLRLSLSRLPIAITNRFNSGINLSRQYIAEKSEEKVGINQLRDIVETLTPDSKVLSKVPIFYQTLFSSRSVISDDFWVAREVEEKQIDIAITRHRQKVGGAMLIKGVHGAGKTSLARYAALHYFEKENVYWLDPPINGSNDPMVFKKALKAALATDDDLEKRLDNLAFNCVIILNNLELWWERSPGGDMVLQEIRTLIDRYSQKILFIINCHDNAYDLINRVVPFDDYLMSTINCRFFNSQQLQQLVMRRHNSSGLELMYNGKSEEALSPLKLSLLFNHFYKVSKGVPGIALNSWTASISDAGSGFIEMQNPRFVEVSMLENLNSDWLVFIAMMIQHKAIDSSKFMRITGLDLKQTNSHLKHLNNAGIFVEKDENSFGINRNIEPHLLKICKEKGLI